MKKKILISVFSCLLIVITVCVIFIVFGSAARKSSLIEYLENKGYSEAEIQKVQVKYLLSDIVVWGGNGWKASVIFKDEPTVTYLFRFTGKNQISLGEISGGTAENDKDDYKHFD